ncbi:MAG: hypothetical protein K2G74_00975 [Muribaculaceae bacterium]|nr:hypothetical protein [Muribaculaceae bacterium]
MGTEKIPTISELESLYKQNEYIVKIYNLNLNPSIYFILIKDKENKRYHVLIGDIDGILPFESNIQEVSESLFSAFNGISEDNKIELKHPTTVNDDIERLEQVINNFISSMHQSEKDL